MADEMDRNEEDGIADTVRKAFDTRIEVSPENRMTSEGGTGMNRSSSKGPHAFRVGGTSGPRVTVVEETSVADQISDVIRDNLEKRLESSVFGDQADNPDISDGFHIVNVYSEILRREHVLEMMRSVGVCTCERCQADVLALTLSSLPAKYCVMYRHSTSPQISYFEKKHRSEIRDAILKACVTVRDHPRHNR